MNGSWDHEWLGGDILGSSWTGFHTRLDKRCLHWKNSTQSIRSVLALLMANSVAASFEVWTRLGIQGQLLLQQLVAQEMPAKLRRNGYLVVECMILHCSLRHSATTTRCRSWVWASLFPFVSCSFTMNSGSVILCRHPRQRNYQCWWQGIGQGTFYGVSCHFVSFCATISYVCVFCLKCLISLQSQPWDDFCPCDLCLGPRVSTCNAFEHVATVPTVANIGLLSKGGSWGCDSFFECFIIRFTWNWKKSRSFHPLIARIISFNVARHFGRTANCDRWTCA